MTKGSKTISIVQKAIEDPTRKLIFVLLLQRPGLNVSQIARRVNKDQSTITDHIKILEAAKLCKVKYDSIGKGVSKLCYPSFIGIFEEAAKLKNIKLTKKEEEIIDKAMSHHKSVGNILEVRKKSNKLKQKLSFTALLPTLLLPSIKTVANDMISDKEYKKIMKEFITICEKIFL